ncbi:MAG: riboflavin synthase [Candidatus Gastranaerophilaceae bacterium]
MFTGIIEEIGIIKEFSKSGKNALVMVECKQVLENTKIGDSIAIDGVCQTVTEISSNSFSAQVSFETLGGTTFSRFKSGMKVNLERALTLSSRLGGHIVSGHVDGMTKVKNIQKLAEFYSLKFEVEKNLAKYLAKKGSVALNGVSLTISDINSSEFGVAVIPHTFENSNLKSLKSGDFVNIEVDILAKYVEKFLSTGNNRTIDENFLKENGFF